MNKSRIPVVLMAAALTASSFGTLPVCASSVTDLEQQAEDLVNESVIKSAAADTLDTEDEEEDTGANKADVSAVAAESYEIVTIKTVKEFQEFARNCRYDTWSRNKNVVLEADLDFSKEDFEPVRTFGGIFDGNGHTISGISITGDVAETACSEPFRIRAPSPI